MLGDTAVAVHPNDPRHRDLIGRHVALPLTGRTIPVIGDPVAANMEFGSGAVKITPGHDFNDFETALRNGLPRLTILDKQARLNEHVPERYRGLDRFEARERVVEDLRAEGLLERVEAYRYMPGRSHRTGAVVEPMSIGKQWFVDAARLAVPAIEAVREGRTVFVPQMWEKTYFNWMENIREWCISRQLWWGHRIPAWYAPDGRVFVAMDKPTVDGVSADALVQDEDVLDTWFSSALWPFSTLGWPERTAALRKWYPTSVMETGYDIIFFWVARMMMMGLHFMGEVPFRVVYLHGMVRDKHGKKMSKTKGNVIDPLHLIEGVVPSDLDDKERGPYEDLFREFPDGIAPQGADAMRFALSILSAQGRDVKLDVRRIEGYRAFLNKLWQATRFALNTLGDFEPRPFDYADSGLGPADRWVLGRLHRAVRVTNEALDAFNFSEACETLYHFVWGELCDWYVELSKATLYDKRPENEASRRATQATLLHCLDVVMRLLHPFAPFVTEELWQALPLPQGRPEALAVADWPTPDVVADVVDHAEMARALEVITGVRAVRGNNNIGPGVELPRLLLFTDDEAVGAALKGLSEHIGRQVKAKAVEVCRSGAERPAPAATSVAADVEIVIPLAGVIDLDAERARLRKELDKVEADIAFVQGKLQNDRFVSRAPADIVQKEREKLQSYLGAKRALEEGLAALP
jgi:valyl-tRNA synthetase